ncbi:hypothetical protein HC891_17760 [Candidatus Gracilibacteria bacterium]|nr:hypothetical protein [Candidatus Gracilibacteria bacterium]
MLVPSGLLRAQHTVGTPVGAGISPVLFGAETAAASAQPSGSERADAAHVPLTSLQVAGDEQWNGRFGIPGVPYSAIEMVAATADGTIYIGGDFEERVLGWNGEQWFSLNGGLDSGMNTMTTVGNTLYVAGNFITRAGGVSVKGLAKWSAGKWSRVGAGAGPENEFNTGSIYALAASGADLYVGGEFTKIDGVAAHNIAHWDGKKWSALGAGVGDKSWDDSGIYGGQVNTLALSGDRLYVGGGFAVAGSIEQAAANVAVWNGTVWSALGAGVGEFDDDDDALVTEIAVDGSKVYVGGFFPQAGAVSANNVALWNGTVWSALGDGLSNDFGEDIKALFVSQGVLYAGGTFDFAGAQQIYSFARWSNNDWSAVPGATLGEFAEVSNISARPGGGFIVVGEFSALGDLLANNIALYTGTGWETIGRGVTGIFGTVVGHVNAMVADEDGRLYAGGRFNAAGGVVVNNVALWDGKSWQALGAGITGEGDLGGPQVNALTFYNGELYVGGAFATAGGATSNGIAKWNPTTKQWSSVGSGVQGDVMAFAVGHGRLYVGGRLENAGGQPVKDIAFWDGTQWGAPNAAVQIYQVFDTCSEQGTSVYALTVIGNRLYIGGDFRLVYTGGDRCALSSYILANHMLIWDAVSGDYFLAGAQNAPGVSGNTIFGRPVQAFAPVGDLLVVGGNFTAAGSANASALAIFNPANDAWAAVGGAGAAGRAARSAAPRGERSGACRQHALRWRRFHGDRWWRSEPYCGLQCRYRCLERARQRGERRNVHGGLWPGSDGRRALCWRRLWQSWR